MKATVSFAYFFFILAALVQAQGIQKRIVLHDGYEGNRIVRNHVEVYYNQVGAVTDGYVVITKVVEFIKDEAARTYGSYLKTDTLVQFTGKIKKGRKHGTFLAFPPGNIFYVETYQANIKQGVWKGYYTIGMPYCEGYLHKNVLSGEYWQYYANGKLALHKQNLNRKTAVTQHEDYYANGQLCSKGLLYKDVKVNEWQYFNNQGQYLKTEYYTNRGRLLTVKTNELQSLTKVP